MRKKFIRGGLAAAMLVAATFGATACGSDDTAAPETNNSVDAGEATTGDESAEFVADLTEGVKIISDQLAEDPAITQIMLASDVEQPTQKYGMWVMPYYPSEAVDSFISTVQVEDGNFVVTATSAESGKEWQMDQDGNLSEVAE